MVQLRQKCIAVVLSIFVVFTLAGCGPTKEEEGTQTQKPQETQTQAKKDPVKLTMFLSNAGFTIGDGNINDNPYIQVVNDMANVKLDITYPESADNKTKFDLMMASGNLPDLVHSFYPDDVNKYGQSGAFLPLNDIIKNSPILSKLYSEEVLNSLKASDGNIYGIYSLDAKVPQTTIARLDLIDELNGGKVPATPEEWYDFMKKIKTKNAEAVPYSSQGQLASMDTFFRSYGININQGGGVEWQLQGDKVISALEHPRMKEAVAFHKKLYDEKLLDPQFVANKGQDWANRILENDVGVWNSGPFSFTQINYKFGTTNQLNKVVGFVHQPVAAGVDPKDVYYKYSPVGGHLISISKKTAKVDAAVKTIEAFLSKELLNAASWGIEGVDYTVKDGKKVPILEVDQKTYWRGAYLFMFQYWPPEAVDHSNAMTALSIPDEGYRQKFLSIIDQSIPIAKQEMDSVGYSPWALMPPDQVINSKKADAQALASTIISKTIVGKITLDQFDQEVKNFAKKYNDISDAYQKYYDSNKAIVQKIINK